MQDVLTIKEAANYLNISSSTIYRLVEKGKIPASRVGGSWRLRRKLLDDWLDSGSYLKQRSVLVVDDDSRVCNLLKEIIDTAGYPVVTVESGEKAIREFERQHFDLVFLDLVLPDISGTDILSRIKASGKKTMVAIVTAYGDDPIALEAMSMGPLLLIRKPFRVDDILEVLNIVLRARR